MLQEISESLDGILDTVSAQHSISNLLGLIKPDGKLVILGVPPEVNPISHPSAKQCCWDALLSKAGALCVRVLTLTHTLSLPGYKVDGA